MTIQCVRFLKKYHTLASAIKWLKKYDWVYNMRTESDEFYVFDQHREANGIHLYNVHKVGCGIELLERFPKILI
jgi:hypothetical protein